MNVVWYFIGFICVISTIFIILWLNIIGFFNKRKNKND